MIIQKLDKLSALSLDWDDLTENVYQKRDFLAHLEKTNPCGQVYYLGYENGTLISAAVTYRLKVNLFTYSGLKLNIPMQVIGVPASVDANGLIGDKGTFADLVKHILAHNRGLVLGLNTNEHISLPGLITMDTLPGLIFENRSESWAKYMEAIRHPYRRRIQQALERLNGAEKREEACSAFTREHYDQYLQIMKRTKTKLEVLSYEFFSHLPKRYRLISFYHKEKLITWHISCMDEGVYYFLFGGMDYTMRDPYDAYNNNLIALMQEGMEKACRQINFGQTAEIPKTRLGAELAPRKMFLYHHRGAIRWVLKKMRPVLSYKIKTREAHIYHKTKG